MSDLAQALMVAIRVHSAQTDRQGAPYLLHVLRVVEGVSDEAKVVAALHDVIEDGGATGERLVLNLDLSGSEGAALRILTREPWMSYAEYIDLIARHTDEQGALARQVKIADLLDHLQNMPTEVDCRPCAGSGAFWGDPRPCVECAGAGRKSVEKQWAPLKARYERALTTLQGSQG